MTTDLSGHLSEEAINDVLIGLGTPQSDAHLAACSACSSRMREFHTEMAVFNQTTLAWSEARSGKSLHIAPGSKLRRVASSRLIWALAATLLLAVGLPIWNHSHNQSLPSSASAPVTAAADVETQIAQDNDLLRAVNVALNESEESPVSEYHLLEPPHSRSRTRPELRMP